MANDVKHIMPLQKYNSFDDLCNNITYNMTFGTVILMDSNKMEESDLKYIYELFKNEIRLGKLKIIEGYDV